MSDMIYTGMHIPTSCSMCWVRGTCEEWAMELHKQRGHGKRLDKCPLRQLVRCKDCVWWAKQEASCQGRCARLGIYPTGAWYCANGAKMDEGDEDDQVDY